MENHRENNKRQRKIAAKELSVKTIEFEDGSGKGKFLQFMPVGFVNPGERITIVHSESARSVSGEVQNWWRNKQMVIRIE